MTMVALIPARAESKRCPHKNTRTLGGRTLVERAIASARQSQVFTQMIVCTDDATVADQATRAQVTVWLREPVPDDQPDIVWVRDVLARWKADAFAILRPTAPFRTASMIQRAAHQFKTAEVHSLRAVQPVMEHPGKMWFPQDGCIRPLMDHPVTNATPWHSSPTQSLPTIYVQNASLEMAWTYVHTSYGTISGTKVMPFFTEGDEGFDVNTEEDFVEAERRLSRTVSA